MSYRDDVTAAIRRVFQLGQTYWQQADSDSYRENAKSAATLERYRTFYVETAEIATRADARIAELELECSQWRDELRIYRETENARIAGLERAVTVRDTEIARLETDLEFARRDAERYRWLRQKIERGPLTIAIATDWSLDPWGGDNPDKEIDAARAGNGGADD